MSFSKHGSKLLSGFRKYRVKPRLSAEVVREFFTSLDCPRALTCLIMFEQNEHEQLAKLAFNPSDYNSLQSLRDAYIATKFLSKYEDLSSDIDLDQVAVKKFLEMETQCKLTNHRLRSGEPDPQFTGPVVWLHNATKRIIHHVLGEFDALEFFESPDWGPGASTLIKRRDASSQLKFQCETGITRDLYNLLPRECLEGLYPLWHNQLLSSGFPTKEVGNKIITVPKDSTTNRVIAVEPGINLWFQKSVGEMINRRLKRFGIDLTDQGRNQHLARIASLTGKLATVDFSSASDTISEALVEELLPQRWFSVMDACRSKWGKLGDRLIKWEKFSSMGNGFTFSLETLVFWAAAKACSEYVRADLPVGAYGDDVIVPTSCFQLYTELVAYYGFTINQKKSHFSGNFRESCGSHYYSGFDVKPIYFRKCLTSLETVFRLANAVRRLALRQGVLCCDARFHSLHSLLVRTVPSALRLRIPDGYGDGGFISNFDEATAARARGGIEGYHFRQYSERGLDKEFSENGYLLAELWRLSKRNQSIDTGSVLPVRLKAINKDVDGRLRAYRSLLIKDLTDRDTGVAGRNSVLLHQTRFVLVKSLARRWPDLGPWMVLS
jgi:hypothetical protein